MSSNPTGPAPFKPFSIEELDEFLCSDDAPEDCMQLSDLDGFLTGIAIGPELIKPSEWLPHVWGGEEPEFRSIEQAQGVINAITGRYNDILECFAEDGLEFEPIFWQYKDGTVIAADWAEGFMDAVQLRPKAWAAIFDDKDAAQLMIPILVFACDDDGEPLLKIAPADFERIADQAAELFPAMLTGIFDFWLPRRAGQPAHPTNPRSPGRNDPCSCGSGKKYKQCCGRH